jgi:hypothetical protein
MLRLCVYDNGARGHDRGPTSGGALLAAMKERVGGVRGVLAERIVVSTSLDPFLTLKALAAYSGLSVRKLRDYLEDPANPLPCYRLPGKILVRRSEFDTWLARFRQVGRADVDQIVADVLRTLA